MPITFIVQYLFLPRYNYYYNYVLHLLLLLISRNIELTLVSIEPQIDLSAVLIQEEALRYKRYSAKTLAERRSLYSKHGRPSLSRYTALNTYTESLIETANLSKCSSASNLSDISSSRGVSIMIAMNPP